MNSRKLNHLIETRVWYAAVHHLRKGDADNQNYDDRNVL